MKLTLNQKKLLTRLLERYEAKINKPRSERFVDAQYEAHFIGFEVQEFHDTMKLLKKKGFISWDLGNKRRVEVGQEYDYNERSYYCLISDSGITLARKCRDEIEIGAKRLILPAWQIVCAGLALIATTVISNLVGDMINKTPNKQVEAIQDISEQLKEINAKLPNIKEASYELLEARQSDDPAATQPVGESTDLSGR